MVNGVIEILGVRWGVGGGKYGYWGDGVNCLGVASVQQGDPGGHGGLLGCWRGVKGRYRGTVGSLGCWGHRQESVEVLGVSVGSLGCWGSLEWG